MCGRFTQTRPWAELVLLYRITEIPVPASLRPRYNIAPTQDVPVVRPIGDGGDRELLLMRWGLVPFWAKSIDIGARLINARAETVRDKPAFRTAFKQRRCLVVADGFYEWQKQTKGPKQPYLVSLADDRPFAFAGLWEEWAPPGGQKLETCTIVTTTANATVAPIHDRMPVILDAGDFDAWLDRGRPPAAALSLMRPYRGAMRTVAVSRRVNRVGNDDPGCVEPLGAVDRQYSDGSASSDQIENNNHSNYNRER